MYNGYLNSKEEIMKTRKLLLVIDMQKDFVDGALGTAEAVSIVPNVLSAIAGYDMKDIFVTRDTHPQNYLETQEGKNLPVVHCVKGTPGWELDKDVAAAVSGAEIFDKPTFGSTAMAERMKELAAEGPIDITLIGLCTDICVISNALLIKAFLPEVPVHCIASCCAGVTPEKHLAALETMRSCQIDVI